MKGNQEGQSRIIDTKADHTRHLIGMREDIHNLRGDDLRRDYANRESRSTPRSTFTSPSNHIGGQRPAHPQASRGMDKPTVPRTTQ
jgi:hypothetical protein